MKRLFEKRKHTIAAARRKQFESADTPGGGALNRHDLETENAAFAQHANTSRNHDHAGTNYQQMVSPNPARVPTEPGQLAFAAIQEIVQILEADSHTDWSVNIEGLRQHLIDMNNVTLSAEVNAVPVDSGVRFTVKGLDLFGIQLGEWSPRTR